MFRFEIMHVFHLARSDIKAKCAVAKHARGIHIAFNRRNDAVNIDMISSGRKREMSAVIYKISDFFKVDFRQRFAVKNKRSVYIRRQNYIFKLFQSGSLSFRNAASTDKKSPGSGHSNRIFSFVDG